MYCRAHQALPSKRKIIQTGQELMEEWIYLHGLVGIREIGHVFDCSSTARPQTSKRRTALNSARRIGISTISNDVLTVDEEVCGWLFKNRKIGHVFCHISTTRARTSKKTTPLDSANPGFQLTTALRGSSPIKTGVRDELSSTSSATF